MSKIRKLLKNISIFGISEFASKLLVFIMLPFYTKYLSTDDFGNADLVMTVTNLLIPVFMLQIQSAVMRFTIENTQKKKYYFLNGLLITLLGFALLLVLLPAFKALHLFDGYYFLFYLLYFVTALNSLLAGYAKGLGKLTLIGTVGVINTAFVVGFNILFLAVLKTGIWGYLLSSIIGTGVSALIYCIFTAKDISLSRKYAEINTSKELAAFSLPLVPNSVAWWGVSSANKIVIKEYIDSSTLGLYSAASRIPSIISVLQTIISEAMVLSVLEQYDVSRKDDAYFSVLYKTYSLFSIIVTLGVIVASKILALFLFANSFYDAWKYIPFLCLPPLWGSLSGYLGTFYSASKKNGGMFISTIVGCGVVLAFSLTLVRFWGINAILYGNIAAYIAIWLYRWLDVKKHVKIKANMISDISSWAVLLLLSFGYTRMPNNLSIGFISGAAIVLIGVINIKPAAELIRLVKSRNI